jgi:hypothetical protein
MKAGTTWSKRVKYIELSEACMKNFDREAMIRTKCRFTDAVECVWDVGSDNSDEWSYEGLTQK